MRLTHKEGCCCRACVEFSKFLQQQNEKIEELYDVFRNEDVVPVELLNNLLQDAFDCGIQHERNDTDVGY